MVHVWVAGEEDAGHIARLNRLFNGVEAPPEAYAQRLRDPLRVDTVLLAEVDGQVAGIANLRLAPSVFYAEPYAELSELFVEEGFRRRGMASALVRAAEALAAQAGSQEIIILTDFYNHAAQMLYFRLGYEVHDLALSKELRPTEG